MADFFLIDVSHFVFTRALPLAGRLVRCYLDLCVMLSFSCPRLEHVHTRGLRSDQFNPPMLEARAT